MQIVSSVATMQRLAKKWLQARTEKRVLFRSSQIVLRLPDNWFEMSGDSRLTFRHANRFFGRYNATARKKMASCRDAHRLRADDGLSARRSFESRETCATSGWQKRQSRR